MQTALSMRRKPGVDSFRRKPTSASPSFDVLGFCRPVVGRARHAPVWGGWKRSWVVDSLLRMVEKECCKLKKGGIMLGKRSFLAERRNRWTINFGIWYLRWDDSLILLILNCRMICFSVNDCIEFNFCLQKFGITF